MLQKISSVFVVYRHKTLTGSPDPTHANGTDKPCNSKLTLQSKPVGEVVRRKSPNINAAIKIIIEMKSADINQQHHFSCPDDSF